MLLLNLIVISGLGLCRADHHSDAPPYPPWAFRSGLPILPDCMSRDKHGDCGNITSFTDECTSLKCTRKDVYGDCTYWEYMTELNCMCKELSAQSCRRSCEGVVQTSQVYQWLNATCSVLADWSGLPQNWTSLVNEFDMVDYKFSPAWGWEGPSCLQDCDPDVSQPVREAVFNGTAIVQALNASDIRLGYEPYYMLAPALDGSGPDVYTEMDMYWSRGDFCQSYSKQGLPSCCSSPLDSTKYLLWFHTICSKAKAGSPLPNDWRDQLKVVNSTTDIDASIVSVPSCTQGVCTIDLQALKSNLTSQKCIVDTMDNCTSTPTVINIDAFCSNIDHESLCPGACQLSWERAELLRFMNNSCGPEDDWDGLPANWTSLLSVQDTELSPWAPRITVNITRVQENSEAQDQREVKCPSNAAKLGVFAAVNLVSHSPRSHDDANFGLGGGVPDPYPRSPHCRAAIDIQFLRTIGHTRMDLHGSSHSGASAQQ